MKNNSCIQSCCRFPAALTHQAAVIVSLIPGSPSVGKRKGSALPANDLGYFETVLKEGKANREKGKTIRRNNNALERRFLSGHKGDTRASSGPLQKSTAKKGSIIYECSGQKRAI